MSHGEKSAYYRALKEAGYEFDQHYREYTTEDLRQLASAAGLEVTAPPPKDPLPTRDDEVASLRNELEQLKQVLRDVAQVRAAAGEPPRPTTAGPLEREEGPQTPEPKPLAHSLDPSQHAGVTQNSHGGEEIIKVDEFGNQWLQLEVPKPAYPKPRGRRVLRYNDPGTTMETIKVGDYVESFEVAGDPRNARPAEIKVTLPSYQTGIYRSPSMPFKIHTYQGKRAFDLHDVQRYYGGRDFVPAKIKKTYVSNDLCYDMSSTIIAIEDEYRERILKAEKGLTP